MRKLFLSLVALLSIGGAYSFANYTMTQGAGTTFGSAVVGGFHYVQMFICDVTTPAQCAAVSAGGAQKVDGTGGTFPVTGPLTDTQLRATAVPVSGTVTASGPLTDTQLRASAVPVTANAGTNLNTSALALSATQGATTVAPATVPTTAAAETEISLLKALTNLANSPTALNSQYPATAVPYTASATGTTAATAATLTGAASVTTYICGFSIRANATAAANGNSTVAGTITGTLNFTQWTAPVASGVGITEMIFSPCVPASAANTSIVVTSGAPGTGGVVSVSAWGYKL